VDRLVKAPGDRVELCFDFDAVLGDGEEIAWIPTPALHADLTLHGLPATDGRRVYCEISGGVKDSIYPIPVELAAAGADKKFFVGGVSWAHPYSATWQLHIRAL